MDDEGDVSKNFRQGRATRIAAGLEHCVALGEDGTLTSWGSNTHGQCDVPAGLSNVVDIAAGGHTSMAILADGTVAAWGSETWGLTWVPDGLRDVAALAVGATSFAFALRTNGQIVGWGTNHVGETDVPRGQYAKVAAGFGNGWAIGLDGRLVGWGNHGRSAERVPPPFELQSQGARLIATTGESALAAGRHAKVYAWGSPANKAGMLDVPEGLGRVVDIAAANFTCAALDEDGAITTWGETQQVLRSPELDSPVERIAVGDDRGIALLSSGKVLGWGRFGDVPAELANPRPFLVG